MTVNARQEVAAPPRPATAPPGREPGRPGRIRLRKVGFLAVVVGVPAWALHRSLAGDGELVNRGGLALLDDLLVQAFRPSLDPDFLRVVADAAATTVALALLGSVGALLIGVVGGLVLADVPWSRRPPWPVRVLRFVLRGALIAVRAVHELVWALLFVTVLGFDPLVAVLALALPFGAQSAQVFGETFDAVPAAPLRALQDAGARPIPALAYALLPETAPLLVSYSFYRFECALRSAVVLGVAGAGGLGFEVTVSLQSRNWDEVWTIIGVLLLMAGAVEWWSNRVRSDVAVVTCADWSAGRELDGGPRQGRLRRTTTWSLAAVVPAVVAAWWWVGLAPAGLVSDRTRAAAGRLLADMWPPSLPEGGWGVLLGSAADTLAMAVLAMVLAVAVTVTVGPWASRPRADRRGPAGWGRRVGWGASRLLLLVLRSVPPTVWAIVALLAFYPGIIPGAVALGVYTAGILGRLTAEAWETMDLAPRDALRNVGVPRVVAATASLAPPSVHHLLTYSLYRFEICVRDTAIVGVVGAAGLGRLLSERLAVFDLDVVLTVLLASVVISVAVEFTGSRVRRGLRA